MVVNIAGFRVTLTQSELDEYLKTYPIYKENYYIIKK